MRAVEDVSFTLGTNEIITVVGESGSGKSTLARLILRLMPLTEGRIVLNGRDVTDLKRSQLHAYWREVQAVFQDPFAAFNQFFTVRRLLVAIPLLVVASVLVFTVLHLTTDPAAGLDPVRDAVAQRADEHGHVLSHGPIPARDRPPSSSRGARDRAGRGRALDRTIDTGPRHPREAQAWLPA